MSTLSLLNLMEFVQHQNTVHQNAERELLRAEKQAQQKRLQEEKEKRKQIFYALIKKQLEEREVPKRAIVRVSGDIDTDILQELANNPILSTSLKFELECTRCKQLFGSFEPKDVGIISNRIRPHDRRCETCRYFCIKCNKHETKNPNSICVTCDRW